MKKFLISLVFFCLSIFLVPVDSSVWSSRVSFLKKNANSLTLCGTIQFANPVQSPIAGSFLLSIRVCNGAVASFHSVDNDQDSITKAVLKRANDEVSLLIGKNLNLKAGDTYNLGICFYATDLDGVDENDLKFGLDLSDNVNPSCTGADCVLSCGNGECSNDESENSCPFDCLTSECTKTIKKENKRKGIVDGQNVWPASIIVQMTSNTKEEVCGKIFISHNTNFVAISHILTFEVPSYKAKISEFLGYESALIRGENGMLVYRQLANDVIYRKDIDYIAASFCLIPKEGFNFNRDIRVGADLKDQASNCKPVDCKVDCGNKVCNQLESALNCAVDCNPRT